MHCRMQIMTAQTLELEGRSLKGVSPLEVAVALRRRQPYFVLGWSCGEDEEEEQRTRTLKTRSSYLVAYM